MQRIQALPGTLTSRETPVDVKLLQTKRLLLRPRSLDDFKLIVSMDGDPEVAAILRLMRPEVRRHECKWRWRQQRRAAGSRQPTPPQYRTKDPTNRSTKSGAGGLAHLVVCEAQVASHAASGLASPFLTEFARALC
jgi:hypothetical protein